MAYRTPNPGFYLDLVRRARKVILVALITGIISGVSSAALIALINRSANDGVQGAMLVLSSGFVALLLVRLVSGVLSKVMLINLAQSIVRELRLALSRKILGSPLRGFEEIGIPRMMAALTDDIVTLSETFGSIPILCIDLSIIAACLVYIGWLSLPLLLLTLAFVFVGVISYRWLADTGLRRLALARQKENTLFEHLRAMTEGFKELKLNAKRQEEFFHSHLKSTMDQYKDLNIGALKLFALADGWGEMLFFVPVGLVLFLTPSVTELPQEVQWGYVITIIFLIGPLSNIVHLLPGIGRSYVAAQSINSLEVSLAQEANGASYANLHPADEERPWRELQLTGVSHSYKGNGQEKGFTVGPIDLTLYPGELVFLTGGNGCGKSTLGKLITGLYTPDTGKIDLDGTQICGENSAWYSQHFSAIFSDYYVFGNLMGVTEEDTATKADAYLYWLGLSDKIRIANGRFSSTELSSGQQRRLAMITALLEDRPIYVFDEWAADQDAEFRGMFYHELLPTLKKRGKGLVVISHDERYFSVADRIVKLEYGKVVSDRRR